MGNACSNVLTAPSAHIPSHDTHSFHLNIHPVSTQEIRLLSYNLFIRPPGINNNGNDYKDERIQCFLDTLSKFDIICLQEMFEAYSSRKAYVIAKAKEAGFLYHCVPPSHNVFSQHFIDSGLLILSRFPIDNCSFYAYNDGIGSDYYVNKGALYAQVRVGQARLHLFTSHTQATYDKTAKYMLKRQEQFTMFQAFVSRTLEQVNYKQGEMVLLTGDLNVNSRATKRYSRDAPEVMGLIREVPELAKNPEFSEYEVMMNRLKGKDSLIVEDVLLDNLKEHPCTFGNYYLDDQGQRRPLDAVLTNKSSQTNDECIDYIIKVAPKTHDYFASQSIDDNKPALKIQENSAVVEKFLVQGRPFGQLSDHYGVKVTLEYAQPQNDSDKSEETAVASQFLYRHQEVMHRV